MIVKSYNEFEKLFIGENKDCVKIADGVKAFWVHNRERNETCIGIFINEKCIIEVFPETIFEIVIEGF